MKSIFKSLLIALVLTGVNSGVAYAATTAANVVQRIQVTSTGTAYFRPAGLGSWGGDVCPNASYAYINKNVDGYEQILSLVLSSKLNESPIYFIGTCNSTNNYFLVTYAILH